MPDLPKNVIGVIHDFSVLDRSRVQNCLRISTLSETTIGLVFVPKYDAGRLADPIPAEKRSGFAGLISKALGNASVVFLFDNSEQVDDPDQDAFFEVECHPPDTSDFQLCALAAARQVSGDGLHSSACRLPGARDARSCSSTEANCRFRFQLEDSASD